MWHRIVPAEPELTFQEDNQLEPYSTLSVPFSFRPQRPESQSIGLRLEFDNPSCPPIDIQVDCRGVSVPIFVEKQVMDFKTCLFGKLYRMPLVLRNRGNIALKCLTHVPRGFRDGALEFSPTMGFVQAADKATGEPGRFEMQMKFKPSRALFKRLGEHANPETGRISVPIRVVAPDQVLPVIFTLTAKLTSSTIEISPPTIDFGQCFTSQVRLGWWCAGPLVPLLTTPLACAGCDGASVADEHVQPAAEVRFRPAATHHRRAAPGWLRCASSSGNADPGRDVHTCCGHRGQVQAGCAYHHEPRVHHPMQSDGHGLPATPELLLAQVPCHGCWGAGDTQPVPRQHLQQGADVRVPGPVPTPVAAQGMLPPAIVEAGWLGRVSAGSTLTHTAATPTD